MISVQDVIEAVARKTGTTPELLRGPRRSRPLAYPRQLGYFLAAELCPGLSLPTIAKAFGGRDHTTIMWGIRQVQKRMQKNPEIEKLVNELGREIRTTTAQHVV